MKVQYFERIKDFPFSGLLPYPDLTFGNISSLRICTLASFELQSRTVQLKMLKNRKNRIIKYENVNFSVIDADIHFSMITVEISKINGKYCSLFCSFSRNLTTA